MRLLSELRVHALLILLLGGTTACKREAQIEPGEDLFSVLDEVVLEVSLRAPQKQARAQRGRLAQPFRYTFESGTGRERTACDARPDLDRAAASAYQIRVRDVPVASKAEEFMGRHRSGWTMLEIRSSMDDGDPFRLELLPDSERPERAYARYPGDRRLFSIDSKVSQLLDMACASP